MAWNKFRAFGKPVVQMRARSDELAFLRMDRLVWACNDIFAHHVTRFPFIWFVKTPLKRPATPRTFDHVDSSTVAILAVHEDLRNVSNRISRLAGTSRREVTLMVPRKITFL